MKTLIQLAKLNFTIAIQQAFPHIDRGVEAEVSVSTQSNFGHYQCNSAFKLAKLLDESPRTIAEKIVVAVENLPIYSDIQCEIAGAGFINLRFTPDFLANRTKKMLLDDHFGIDKPAKREKIVIDFSSPNVAKEMHVGHLRTTIIGDCLARVFEFLGQDVLRLNHIGDWGTAFGMLITYLLDTEKSVLQEGSAASLSDLVKWYREAKKRFDEDLDFKKRSQLAVVALQRGDEAYLNAWHVICAISKKAYHEIYDLLDITITDRGESFYNEWLKPLMADLEQKNQLVLSDGAKCLFFDEFKNRQGEPLPFILQKSDGGYNYATTDLAAIRHRIDVEKADRLIYVIDAGQSLHMQMLFKAAQMVGYLDPQKVRCDHVAFGLVLGPDGKKFKTRSGETERLIDLLTQAIDKAKTILREKDPGLSDADCEEKARILGINAVKYADLSVHRIHDYAFSYDKMLQFEGNTAAFLLYAYVRTLSILRKLSLPCDNQISSLQAQSAWQSTEITLVHPAEIDLALNLNRFGELLESMTRDLLPHHLTDYLYQLALYFNAFFRDCRVVDDALQHSRGLLCVLTSRVLQQGLTLLGLKVVDRM